MNMKRKPYFFVAFFLIMFFPFKMVFAQTETVTNQDTLKQALSNPSLTVNLKKIPILFSIYKGL